MTKQELTAIGHIINDAITGALEESKAVQRISEIIDARETPARPKIELVPKTPDYRKFHEDEPEYPFIGDRMKDCTAGDPE